VRNKLRTLRFCAYVPDKWCVTFTHHSGVDPLMYLPFDRQNELPFAVFYADP
jgi:hypothetical protein